MGKKLSPQAAELFLADLSHFNPEQVSNSLRKCRQELKFFPTLAEIIDRIDDGRPGPEEAWALIPQSEADSVIWCDEMAEAFGVSRMIDNPIQARMAFLESYKKALVASRTANRPVQWSASFGTDKRSRDEAVRCALEKGRITQGTAVLLLPEMPIALAPEIRKILQAAQPKKIAIEKKPAENQRIMEDQ